ncbi:hypothetical protein Smp_111320 [Schistosoma mansoni]|uniref:hypothetical protein n=1 Tax=Schistosoma mansoni TaxID=6183 RepID=UPI00022C83C2|nr:hypothetical protein Smp_111320 [Schistosoma mansoni]|eukprot:XP_018644544.1 hypothetical protein Smp_111320 [Schistosoma mansoni]
MICTPETSSGSSFLMTDRNNCRSWACLSAGPLSFDSSRFQMIPIGTCLTSLKVVFTAFDRDVRSCMLATDFLLLAFLLKVSHESSEWLTTKFGEAELFPSTIELNIFLLLDFSGVT